MELRQLATFRLLAQNLNFTRTANELGYVQSSVTAQIQALETELGVPLFDRLGKRVSLTSAGQQLLDYAEQMLLLADEARDNLRPQAQPQGTLTITAPETLCTYRLPAVLRAFRDQFPQIRILFQPGPINEVRERVYTGQSDVGFVIDPPFHFVNVEAVALCKESISIVAPPDHPLRQAAGVLPADLAAEALLLTEIGCSYRKCFLDSLTTAGVAPRLVLEFGTVEAIKQCVMVGMGISVLPTVAVTAELARGDLVALPWRGPDLELQTQMIRHRQKWMSAALRAFWDLSRTILTDAAQEDSSRKDVAA